MTPITVFAGKKVAVFGLGGSGLVSASALLAGGADVLGFDDDPASVQRATAAGIPAADLRDADWSKIAALVLAPGVPLTHPKPHWTVALARAAGVEIIGDVELFGRERAVRAPGAAFVAITGTNGKSTTTALVAHILRSAGRDVQMGGNIGVAILSLEPPAPGRVHVVEISSYQADLAPTLKPSVGILLNVTPDHLDRHGTMDNYAAIKERVVTHADTAVIAVDDDYTRAIAGRCEQAGNPTVLVSSQRTLPRGLSIDGSTIVRRDEAVEERLADLAAINTLRGRHNAQNAAAAVAAALALDVPVEAIRRGLASFPGLPHRLEEVGRKGRVLFVNDSKGTNADSTDKALSSFAGDIFWILGGKAKEGGIESLRRFFPKIAKAYLIGEASDAFAKTLEGQVPYSRCGTLDVAVAQAAADAEASNAAEPVVLLSPACASFDQYRNFEVRGDHFRKLVRALI
ncbi:MAG TPA: UDP-N-acetylmuramoyl-L-alanine--D-glutamate ligase [Xanthobacteraceae bacterium]|nr:UDP-N-acetylmuramoyl-L-alanine--D-glutamate ligase [Xanthobacteraceae bacterium]